MYEVEVKVRAEHGPVREALGDQGAERTDVVDQIDTYFDAPHRDFSATDEALRIREERPLDRPPTFSLAYKGPKVDAESKTRREVEIDLPEPHRMSDVLESLGFSPVATVEKERERYALGACTVTLDTVDGLGTFVEAEAKSSQDSMERTRNEVFDVLRKLDLDPSNQLRTSYLELLLRPE
ncbi:MAG: class IV adenylate cyclase [Halodesulfurarchaeum sp.]